jgi:ABC-type glutathione transport system ATPase component
VLAGFLEELDLEGRAALIVTHELDLAARLADRVSVLSGGRIALHADMDDLAGGDERGDQPRRLKAILADVIEGSAA